MLALPGVRVSVEGSDRHRALQTDRVTRRETWKSGGLFSLILVLWETGARKRIELGKRCLLRPRKHVSRREGRDVV